MFGDLLVLNPYNLILVNKKYELYQIILYQNLSIINNQTKMVKFKIIVKKQVFC